MSDFKSNITFEGGPTILQTLQEMWATPSNHCCYCDSQACNPTIRMDTCDACQRIYE